MSDRNSNCQQRAATCRAGCGLTLRTIRRSSGLSVLVALLMVSTTGIAFGQQELRFRSYGTEEGMSSSFVNGITQDQHGFVWVATAFGVNRFDGYEFAVFKHSSDDPDSLPADYVRAVYSDRHGRLWLGTEGGLALFQPDSETFETFLDEFYVRNISEGRNGNLWLATSDGVLGFDPEHRRVINQWKHQIDSLDGLTTNDTLACFEDRSGLVWIATNEGGLNRLDPSSGTVRHFRAEDSPGNLPHDSVLSIYEESDGALWFGTVGGVVRFDASTETFERPPSTEATSVVFGMARDSTGKMWISTYSGLGRLDPSSGRTQIFRYDSSNRDGISDNRIRSLYLSSDDLLWIGTSNRLNLLDLRSARFGLHTHRPGDPHSLSNSYVWSLLRDSRRRLWVGSKGGLDLYDLETSRSLEQFRHDPQNPSSLAKDTVTQIYEDREERLWVTTDGGGLHLFDPQLRSFERFRHDPDNPKSIADDQVRRVYQDGKRRLWIGTSRHGLDRFEPRTNKFFHYQHDPERIDTLCHNHVNSIVEDTSGQLWVATRGGLARFVEERDAFECVRHPDDEGQSIAKNNIFTILEDARNTLWLGSRGGLQKFDPVNNSFESWRTPRGLPDDTVYGILESTDGTLWLSTNQGLSNFDPQTEIFVNYDRSDGLQGLEFNTGAWFADLDERLLFGGTKGFNAFYPDEIETNNDLPLIATTRFLLANQPVDLGDTSVLRNSILSLEELTLDHHDNRFAFEFAALNFRQPEKNKYRYKLEGFNEDWVSTDASDRKAVFTNVPHGDYTFRVIGSNNDGVWNEHGRSIRLTINPPWWLTWWMKVLYFGVGVGAPIAFYYFRLATYRRRELELEQQVADRTTEIRRQHEKLQENFEIMERMARTDALTGLSNRRDFLERLDYEISRAQRSGGPLSLVLADIDEFKEINDQCGHGGGDQILVDLAKLLKASVRPHDTIGRWGGEEFIFLLPDTNLDSAEATAERIRRSIEGHAWSVEDRDWPVTMTFGVAGFEGSNADSFIQHADQALYSGKQQGRNRVVVAQSRITE